MYEYFQFLRVQVSVSIVPSARFTSDWFWGCSIVSSQGQGVHSARRNLCKQVQTIKVLIFVKTLQPLILHIRMIPRPRPEKTASVRA